MVSEAEQVLSVFDRIYIINLPHRTDRQREMQAELRGIGLGLDHPQVTLFPASFPPDEGGFETRGARGCFESHLAVHRDIVQRQVARALVLEDDAALVPDFAARFSAIHDHLAAGDWDMFYSILPLEPQKGDQVIGPDLLRLSPQHGFQMTHFLGFDQSLSRLAVPYFEAMQARPAGDPAGGPMHVDGAYCWLRGAYPDLTVLASRQPLAGQRSSRSDIAQLQWWDRVPGLRQASAALRRSEAVMRFAKRLRQR